MRLVAVTLLVLTALATMPVAPAVNECQGTCQTAVLPKEAGGETYYLYAAGLACRPDDSYCRGEPAPLLTAFLYQETNCEGGLQRYRTIHCVADTVVLL